MRLARSGLGPEPSPSVVEPLEEAERELRTALAELRDVAHGIFPAVLADEGLAAALEAFAEEAAIPVELSDLPERRFETAVETAAYFVVSETATGRQPEQAAKSPRPRAEGVSSWRSKGTATSTS